MAELSLHQVQRIRRICPGVCELCEAPCSPALLVPHVQADPKEYDLSKRFLLLCPLCREHVAQIPPLSGTGPTENRSPLVFLPEDAPEDPWHHPPSVRTPSRPGSVQSLPGSLRNLVPEWGRMM